MSAIWFTSDLHVGHRFVAGLRGHAAVEAHDGLLAARWDATVAPGDHIWVLGDLSAGGSAAERGALAWLADRPGIKHLVAGNHDRIHPLNRDAHKHHDAHAAVFASVAPFARRRINGVEVMLSHFPYDGDHTSQSRYDQYRLRDYGMPLLHGHTHASGVYSTSTQGTAQIHVGVDAWGMSPVPLSAIETALKGV